MEWVLFALVVVLAIAVVVIEVRSRMRRRRTASAAADTVRAEALLYLKQRYDRDEITDEEYFLERTRLLSDD